MPDHHYTKNLGAKYWANLSTKVPIALSFGEKVEKSAGEINNTVQQIYTFLPFL